MRHDTMVTEEVRRILRECKGKPATGAALAVVVEDRLRKAVPGLRWYTCSLRRIGESVAALIEQGWPIASDSRRGYWLATKPEDLEASLAEATKRARATLRRRRLLRTQIRELRGQMRMP